MTSQRKDAPRVPGLSTVTDIICSVVAAVLAALLIAIFLMSAWQIILRNFVGGTWRWIPAYSRLGFIWMVFLGTAVLYKTDEHLTMTFLVNRFSDRAQAIMQLVVHLAMAYMFYEMIFFGLRVANNRMRIRFDTWRLATGYAYMAVPVASAIMLLFAVEKIIVHIIKIRNSGDLSSSKGVTQ